MLIFFGLLVWIFYLCSMIKPMYRIADIDVWPSRWSNTKRQVSDWRVRLQHEANMSASVMFVTLTLQDNELLLHPEPDVQLLVRFFKRLRTYIKRKLKIDTKLKYYWVSEYGDKTHRLHYHALIMSDVYISDDDFKMAITQNWYYGFNYTSRVKSASAYYYTTKYVNKKFFEPHAKSQSLGIGLSWLNKNIDNFVKQLRSGKVPVVINGKYRAALPRYYRKKIVEQYPELDEVFKTVAMVKINDKDYGHSVDFTMSHKAYRSLCKVNEQLFFGVGKIDIVNYVGNDDDTVDYYVRCSPLIAAYLLKHFEQNKWIDRYKKGQITFDYLNLRI